MVPFRVYAGGSCHGTKVVAHSLHRVLFPTSEISENRGYRSRLPIVVVTMTIVEMSVFKNLPVMSQ